MGRKHFGAAAIDRKSARDLQHAIDRKRDQSGAVINQNEAVFAVERGGGCGPVRFRRLPIDGDDAVHRIHQRLLVGGGDVRCIRKTVDRVISPGRFDRPILAAQISRHGRTPAIHRELYRRASNGLKDNMPSKSAKPRRSGPREQTPTRRIAIVAFPGVTLLDISGPAQVFAELEAIELPGPGYSLSYLSTSGGLVPTDVGMMVDTAPIDSVRPHQVDTLVIPGGPGIWEMRKDAAADEMDFAGAAEGASGGLGLPRGVSRWPGPACSMESAPRPIGAIVRGCRTAFPNIRVEPNAIFVKDGRVWSSAGVSAGIDLALAMIEEDFGHTTALDVARRLVVFLEAARRPEPVLHRAGGAGLRRRRAFQRAARLDHRKHRKRSQGRNARRESRNDAPNLRPHLCQPHRHDAGERGRGAARGNRAAVAWKAGKSAGVVEVAKRAGFGDDERMRRAFLRHLGISPTEYRSRFSGG